VRFGLQVETYGGLGGENAFDRMLAVARLAEAEGFESIWYEDHLSLAHEEDSTVPWPQLGCLTTLSALATCTRKVHIGSLVACVPYRNPALLAKTWTTLDVVSHGRAIAGIGAGWNELEVRAYGYEFGTVNKRMEMLEDTARILDEMMRRSPASYKGRRRSIRLARNDPLPVQKPRPPLLIGGNGERRTLRLVARHAEMCNVYGSPEEVERKFAALRRHCEEARRPYEEVVRAINYWVLLASDDGEKAEKRRRFPAAFSIDTPEETVAALQAYETAGTQYVIVKILDTADLTPVRLFAREVMPAFEGR
jgi:alkanesulfonate monooxygenase SsuD/methylene tetrahydromethanopterin reductase-like flavin-dependent oxidoreductase (luciferase family)